MRRFVGAVLGPFLIAGASAQEVQEGKSGAQEDQAQQELRQALGATLVADFQKWAQETSLEQKIQVPTVDHAPRSFGECKVVGLSHLQWWLNG